MLINVHRSHSFLKFSLKNLIGNRQYSVTFPQITVMFYYDWGLVGVCIFFSNYSIGVHKIYNHKILQFPFERKSEIRILSISTRIKIEDESFNTHNPKTQ